MDTDGLGAFFYPVLLTITDKNPVNFYEDTQDSEVSKSPSYGIRKIVLDYTLKNDMRIVVTDDGFIGVFGETIENALRILNTIFATGITFGLGNEIIRRRDLCKFALIGDGSRIQLEQIGQRETKAYQIDFCRSFDSSITIINPVCVYIR